MRIVVIGLGGIGSALSDMIARFLNYSDIQDIKMVLVDGDSYEEKNRERQQFIRIGNKAEIKAKELGRRFNRIEFESYSEFIKDDTIASVIEPEDIVLMGVDNHKTRKLVSDYCSSLNEVVLISGGNDLTDGNVQIYVKREGEDVTPDLCAYHPEIQTPDDRSPHEMSCEELANSEPQIYFTNLGAAVFMCFAFWNVVIKNQVGPCEVYFDVKLMAADPKKREVRKEISKPHTQQLERSI